MTVILSQWNKTQYFLGGKRYGVCLSRCVFKPSRVEPWGGRKEGRLAARRGPTRHPHGHHHAVHSQSSGQHPPPAKSQRLVRAASRPEGNRGSPKPIPPRSIRPRRRRWISPAGQAARRCRRCTRARGGCCSRPATAWPASSGSPRRPPPPPTPPRRRSSARRTRRAPRPCAGRWRRSRASARRWTASGAPSPPRASATSGRGCWCWFVETGEAEALAIGYCNWHSLRKVEQLSEDVDSLKETLDKHSLRQRKRILEAKERAELFERANGESSHVLQIFDDEAQAMQSARSSSRMLDEAFETGVAILHKYSDQRDRLKSAQRKALDVLNTVGLSNSVLKLIEKRHRVDKRIAYGGMIITVVLMVAFWRWTH